MKLLLRLFFILLITPLFAQQQTGTFSISPSPFDANDEITITVSGVDPTTWNGGQPNNIYLWAWSFNQCGDFYAGPVNGNGDWDNSEDYLQMTNNGNGTYSYTLTPSIFYGASDLSQIGILVKAKDGTGDKKTQDQLEYVGEGITVNITNPPGNTVVINSGDNLSISANMAKKGTTTVGSFKIFLNEVQVASGSGTPNYSTTLMNVTVGGTVRVEGTPTGLTETGSCSFEIIISPTVTEQSVPSGMVDGINYHPSDNTKATLVLSAPLKDFVYVAGSFNNYNPDNTFLLKKDTAADKFWIELTGLTPGQVETYQYWVYALSPVANSPQLVKTADPYSTLVLSNFDDPYISESKFPGITTTYLYPAGQFRSVTVLQTDQTAYPWVVTNFNKPKKEDLIIYEVLIRDFDTNRTYQDLIDRIDYFKNLNINAIELMPVMEFEGNESWGYNTAFHMALDKFYGTESKFKEFIDLCHQNGIAVILDVALNHAFGRNPMNRMWMDDPDGDGWGNPSSENPYFNENATHSYSVGSDFDHSNVLTQNYVQRVVKHWIEEFKIDGFRWDLTKGFTQNCTSNVETCTNDYNQDRVDILKDYADYSWSLDSDHYVIFEHLGTNGFGDPNMDGKTSVDEEIEWANYRIGEGKGIMQWSEQWNPYKNLTQGKSSDINISGIGHLAHGFTGKRTIGYPESHDKDRMMYEMFSFGESGVSGNLTADLQRMSALGAVFLTVPGPKMVWHFADLGMDDSIWTCSDGSVNSDYDGNGDGDCKLSTKPQPQWSENWLGDADRSQIYSDWSRLIDLKINADVFEGNYDINTNSQTPKIYIWDDAIPPTELKNVVIIANFNTTSQNVNPSFPYGGTWYDLMDESGSTTVDGTVTSVNLAPGEFKVYGNNFPESLSLTSLENELSIILYPNPVESSFTINSMASELHIYDLTGKLVKEFKGAFEEGYLFNIAELSQSIYIIKVRNNSGNQVTTKLVKL